MQEVHEGRYPQNMDEFLLVIADARTSLESVVERSSERQLTQLHDAGGWSVKDHLYHLAVWERGIRYLLQGKPRHQAMEMTEQQFIELDEDEMNDIIFQKNRDRSLDDVLRVFYAEHQEMVRYLSSPSISWEDLHKPYAEYAGIPADDHTREPVLYWVFGNTAGHFDMHQTWIETILAQAEG